MIRTALEFIKKELDAYIADREQDNAAYPLGSNVALPALDSPGGTITLDAAAHITLLMIGVEEERREGKRPHYLQTSDSDFLKLNPPVELELSLLFGAHQTHYPTALRDISDVAAFFQSNPVFDAERFPALNASVTAPDLFPWRLIERLSFRLHNLSFEQQNNLWSMLGLKYMPCLVYKVNMITVFDRKSKDKMPAVKEFSIEEKA